MGQTRISSKSTLTPNQQTALDSILKNSTEQTNYLTQYLRNIIDNGPSAQRTQQAINLYKQQILPQIIGNLGDSKSSSALNQALSQGAQSLSESLSSDSTNALQLLAGLTQGNSQLALGTQAQTLYSRPSTATQLLAGILNTIPSTVGALGNAYFPAYFLNLLSKYNLQQKQIPSPSLNN